MRARNSQEKAQIAQSLNEHVWPLLAQGKCLPQIYKSYAFFRCTKCSRMYGTR